MFISDIPHIPNYFLDKGDGHALIVFFVFYKTKLFRPLGLNQCIRFFSFNHPLKSSHWGNLVQLLKYPLGNKRCEWMEKAQCLIQHESQDILCRGPFVLVSHSRFCPFKIPVTKVIPEKPRNEMQRLMELITI